MAYESMAAAAAAVSSKHRALDQDEDFCTPKASKKLPWLSLGSIDDYEMLEELGFGAYGSVNKGRHRRTGKEVALKWVHGDGPGGYGAPDHDAISREVSCLAACRGHPSIVGFEDVVTDATLGDVFIVMELVAGGSLFGMLGEPHSEEETRAMMRQLLVAAKAVHGAGVIHRDIKPDNILVAVGKDGQLKLCDFGSATPVKEAGDPYEEERPGTLLYTSPEQLEGSQHYGTAVDMWALGCVMADILTGDNLFDLDASTEEELLTEVHALRDMIAEHGTSVFDDTMPELSSAGREVLAGLLAFDPDKRLTAAAALEHRWFAEEEHLHLA